MRMISNATVPGAFLCDLFPLRDSIALFDPLVNEKTAQAVKHLPAWVPFRREAKKGYSMINRLVTKPYEHVKRDIVSLIQNRQPLNLGT